MNSTLRRRYYNLCRIHEPLAPDDPRNVDIDREAPRVRGKNWVEHVARQVELADAPTLTLFTGLPGSGKSTELRRLAARLSSREGADAPALLTVLIEAEDVLDLTAPIDLPDLLAAVVHETERAVLVAEERDPDEALQDGWLTRLWSWLSRTDVELGKGQYKIPGGPSLVVELKTRPTLRQRMRQTVAQNLAHFLAQVRGAMRELDERARRAGWKGLFVAVDSLEKLRGSVESFGEVLDSADKLFAQHAPHLRLPVHVLYTVPPALRTRHGGIEFMPVVRLHARDSDDDDLDPDGRRVLRELVRRRIPDEHLALLLGEETVEARLDEVFRLSGGHPREIVKVLRELLLLDPLPVDEADFHRVLNEIKAEFQMVIPAEAFAWLAQVHRERALTIANEEHRRAADQVLSNNGVLYYYNGGPWWGLHPAVLAIPGVRRAIDALEG